MVYGALILNVYNHSFFQVIYLPYYFLSVEVKYDSLCPSLELYNVSPVQLLKGYDKDD